jgi:hypothetical protein
MKDKIEELKAMEQFEFTAIVTIFPEELPKGVMYQLSRVLQRGGHMLGVMSTSSYAGHCIQARTSKFEIRDKIDYYRSGDELPQSLIDYLVTMVKMPQVNKVLDPFPEITEGKVKKACDELGIECVELK